MKRIILLILLLSAVLPQLSDAQNRTLPEKRLIALSLDFAGKNKGNLQQVLDHYTKDPKDSLKLRAAEFLIANMTGHASYAGYLQKGMSSLIEHVAKHESSGIWLDHAGPRISHLRDSIVKLSKETGPAPFYMFDNKVISSELLIENIEYAFKAWNFPWSKHLSFSEFCDYILPYRFFDEPLASWRPAYMEKFSWVVKAMEQKGSTDPMEAGRLIKDTLGTFFRYNPSMLSYPAAFGPMELLKGGMGRCLDHAGYDIFAMRAMGIPVVLEEVPHWANRSMGHAYSSVKKKDGTFERFSATEMFKGTVPSKVYRNFYRIQDDRFVMDEVSIGDVPPLFDRFRLDITKTLVPAGDIALKLPDKSCAPGETLFLCLFDNQKWIPFTSAETVDGTSVLFKDIAMGAIYLPVSYKTKMLPLSPPLQLDKKGELHRIVPSLAAKEKILLSRKYPFGEKQWEWIRQVMFGKFQGANSPDFSDAQEITTIYFSEIAVNKYAYDKKESFRYIRYLFPDSCSGSLAEIEIYADSLKDIPLSGKPIASAKVSKEDLRIAFDGQLDNYIATQLPKAYDGEWIGLDLGEQRAITGVGLSPRNDTNGILQGMHYELFYWEDGWISLGTGIRDDKMRLIYDNVPKGALLVLRNHTEGTEERIFTCENGQQVWW